MPPAPPPPPPPPGVGVDDPPPAPPPESPPPGAGAAPAPPDPPVHQPGEAPEGAPIIASMAAQRPAAHSCLESMVSLLSVVREGDRRERRGDRSDSSRHAGRRNRKSFVAGRYCTRCASLDPAWIRGSAGAERAVPLDAVIAPAQPGSTERIRLSNEGAVSDCLRAGRRVRCPGARVQQRRSAKVCAERFVRSIETSDCAG